MKISLRIIEEGTTQKIEKWEIRAHIIETLEYEGGTLMVLVDSPNKLNKELIELGLGIDQDENDIDRIIGFYHNENDDMDELLQIVDYDNIKYAWVDWNKDIFIDFESFGLLKIEYI